jgi:hypothetical protein
VLPFLGLTLGLGAGDMEVDSEVYDRLSSSGLFSSMELDVDEVGYSLLLPFNEPQGDFYHCLLLGETCLQSGAGDSLRRREYASQEESWIPRIHLLHNHNR